MKTCDKRVQGYPMSYPCTLPADHVEGVPEDPEPCLAREVTGAVARHEAWVLRQERRVQEQTDTACPVRGGLLVCVLCEAPAGTACRAEEVTVDVATGEEVVEHEDLPAQAVPTKQRPGDQRLPTGGRECAQDLIIAAMEESKRVGTERYGQPLMTFNGRKGLLDLVEEARDFFVYATMLAAEASATRETQHAVLAERYGPEQAEEILDLLGGALLPAEAAVYRYRVYVDGEVLYDGTDHEAAVATCVDVPDAKMKRRPAPSEWEDCR